MKKSGWIEFQYKPPYSAVQGRVPPDMNFLVVVAIKVGDHIFDYKLLDAIEATNLYHQEPDKYVAWTPVYEYEQG